MKLALELVKQVADDPKLDDTARKIYGGLCHDFPILTRTCGLCQAVAFSADKAQSDEQARAEAHQLLLRHIGAILGVPTDGKGGANDPLLKAIMEADALQYMLYTRQVLHAWVYFKRFAVSVLGVKTGGSDQ
jgi:CRISPR-associated protein Cmr5